MIGGYFNFIMKFAIYTNSGQRIECMNYVIDQAGETTIVMFWNEPVKYEKVAESSTEIPVGFMPASSVDYISIL